MAYLYSPSGYIPVSNPNNKNVGLDMGCEAIGFTLQDYMAQCPRYDSITPKRDNKNNGAPNASFSSPYCISSYVDRIRSTPVRPSKSYDIGTKFAYDKSSDEVVDLRKYYSAYARNTNKEMQNRK